MKEYTLVCIVMGLIIAWLGGMFFYPDTELFMVTAGISIFVLIFAICGLHVAQQLNEIKRGQINS